MGKEKGSGGSLKGKKWNWWLKGSGAEAGRALVRKS